MRAEIELAPPLNDGFDQPTEVSDADLAFGGDMMKLLPKWKAVPDEFWAGRNKMTEATMPWCVFVGQWFYGGWESTSYNLYTRPDVDSTSAVKHVGAILKSMAPDHYHKMAAAAWLLSRWFAKIELKR